MQIALVSVKGHQRFVPAVLHLMDWPESVIFSQSMRFLLYYGTGYRDRVMDVSSLSIYILERESFVEPLSESQK